MSSQPNGFLIKGLTTDGRPFRPSDWAERLCGVMSAFGSDGRMQYSPFVYPISEAGLKCVVISVGLCDLSPGTPARFFCKARPLSAWTDGEN